MKHRHSVMAALFGLIFLFLSHSALVYSASFEVVDDLWVTDRTGVGTTAPFGLLQVGTLPTTPGLIVTTGNNVGIGTTAPIGLLQVGTSPGTATLTIRDGKVGIGKTNPVAKLEIAVSNTAPANNLYIQGAAGGRLIISQSDGGCSSCGVDNLGTTWSCIDVTCP